MMLRCKFVSTDHELKGVIKPSLSIPASPYLFEYLTSDMLGLLTRTTKFHC